MLCLRVYLKMSNEVHYWRRKLHITPWYKTSGQQKSQRSLNWGSCEDVRQRDPVLQHESCSSGVGVIFAGNSGSSVPRPPWHGLGQWLPPELQLSVSPRRGHCSHQELLQRAGRLGPLVDVWVPAYTRGPGAAQWLLVGWHQPCWHGVVSSQYQWFTVWFTTWFWLYLWAKLTVTCVHHSVKPEYAFHLYANSFNTKLVELIILLEIYMFHFGSFLRRMHKIHLDEPLLTIF